MPPLSCHHSGIPISPPACECMLLACVLLIVVCCRCLGWCDLAGVAAIAAVRAPWSAGARPPPVPPPAGLANSATRCAYGTWLSLQGQRTPGLPPQYMRPCCRLVCGGAALIHFCAGRCGREPARGRQERSERSRNSLVLVVASIDTVGGTHMCAR